MVGCAKNKTKNTKEEEQEDKKKEEKNAEWALASEMSNEHYCVCSPKKQNEESELEQVDRTEESILLITHK